LFVPFGGWSDDENEVVDAVGVVDSFFVLFEVVGAGVLKALLLELFPVDHDLLTKNHVSAKGELSRGVR